MHTNAYQCTAVVQFHQLGVRGRDGNGAEREAERLAGSPPGNSDDAVCYHLGQGGIGEGGVQEVSAIHVAI